MSTEESQSTVIGRDHSDDKRSAQPNAQVLLLGDAATSPALGPPSVPPSRPSLLSARARSCYRYPLECLRRQENSRTVTPASLSRRVNAATIDLLVIVLGAFGLPYAVPGDNAVSRALRFGLFWVIPFFLEPALLRVVGCTVGQACLRLRVVPVRARRPLGILRLTLRYWLKLLLGLPSLLYILFTHQRVALHDKATGTAVLWLPGGARAPADIDLDLYRPSDPTLPPPWRRFAAFIVWWVIAEVGLVALLAVGLVALDALDGELSLEVPDDHLFDAVSRLLELVMMLGIAHLGASGRLPGARRSRQADSGL